MVLWWFSLKQNHDMSDIMDNDSDLQNTTHKPNHRAIRTPLKPRVNSGAPEGLAVSAPLVTPVVLLLNDTNII